MSCSACPALAERWCSKCQRRYCGEHDGHKANFSRRWCPWCSTARNIVNLEKFSDRQIGMALAPEGARK